MAVSYTHLDVYKRQTQAYEITQEALGEVKKSAGATKLNLNELPKTVEIKKFLDQYVIGQDDAKRFLSVSVYNHYKRCLLYTSRCV